MKRNYQSGTHEEVISEMVTPSNSSNFYTMFTQIPLYNMLNVFLS